MFVNPQTMRRKGRPGASFQHLPTSRREAVLKLSSFATPLRIRSMFITKVVFPSRPLLPQRKLAGWGVPSLLVVEWVLHFALVATPSLSCHATHEHGRCDT